MQLRICINYNQLLENKRQLKAQSGNEKDIFYSGKYIILQKHLSQMHFILKCSRVERENAFNKRQLLRKLRLIRLQRPHHFFCSFILQTQVK